jgi:hypothetical protein
MVEGEWVVESGELAASCVVYEVIAERLDEETTVVVVVAVACEVEGIVVVAAAAGVAVVAFVERRRV